MKVSVNWIQEYLDKKLSVTDMVEALEHAGVEVEEVMNPITLDKKLVVALVKKVVQHPNADRLRLADVSIGSKIVHVVCGAPNLAEGQKVVLAQVGTVLPDGTTITASEIRGQLSNGMICSQRELGLGEDHNGILVLDPGIKEGTVAQDVFGSGEVIDVTTAANRSDLQSIIGLAREIAAMTDTKLKIPGLSAPVGAGAAMKVRIESDKVLRYLAATYQISAAVTTSLVYVQRLQDSGTRAINLTVDATNYVLHEYGQPLHAFDADKVTLPIIVRAAKKGEKLVTLDGVERILSVSDLVIADGSGPIALAGVMGGLATSVTAETKQVIIEAATFAGASIRKTATRYGLRSEASARYERGLPVELAEIGLRRMAEILTMAAGARPTSGIYDSLKHLPAPRVVNLRPTRVTEILGMPVETAAMKRLLERLGFEAVGTNPIKVTVPWWRGDVQLEADLIEEVGRSLGYDDLPATLPKWQPGEVQFDRRQAKIWRLKAALQSLGLFEVVTYSFVSADQLESVGYELVDHLRLKNPLSIEQEYLRGSLLPSLLAVTVRNSRYSNDFGIFELSRVFDAPRDRTNLPNEPNHIGVMRRGNFAGVREVLDLLSRELHVSLSVEASEVTGLHPYRSARISLRGDIIGVLGEVHPAVAKAQKLSGAVSFIEIDLDALLAASTDPTYRPVSKYPEITRDVAVVVSDETQWSDLRSALKDYDASYVSEYRGTDVPTGHKSVALRVTFSSMERTLTTAEAEAGVAQVLDILEREFKAKLRA
jgi:phenylalanyl-tRNA synthetase beta chain